MFCGKCGMKIEDIAVFCPYCGNQAPGRSSLGEQPEAPVDRWERTEYLPQNGAELHMADGARMDDGSAETELLGGYGARLWCGSMFLRRLLRRRRKNGRRR